MELIQLLLFFLCFIPLMILVTLIVVVVWMKRNHYRGIAIVLVFIGLILIPIGCGLMVLEVHSYRDANDSTEERTIYFENQSTYSVTYKLVAGDRIKITFQSTIPLDVTLSHEEEYCYDEYKTVSETLVKNSQSAELVYRIEKRDTYFVNFEETEGEEGSANIKVDFDRSPTRDRAIIGIMISGIIAVTSVGIFFWVYYHGKSELSYVPEPMLHPSLFPPSSGSRYTQPTNMPPFLSPQKIPFAKPVEIPDDRCK